MRNKASVSAAAQVRPSAARCGCCVRAFSSISRPPNEAYTSIFGGALERSSAIL